MFQPINKPILKAHQELAEMIATAQFLRPCTLAVDLFQKTYAANPERAAFYAKDLHQQISDRQAELSKTSVAA